MKPRESGKESVDVTQSPEFFEAFRVDLQFRGGDVLVFELGGTVGRFFFVLVEQGRTRLELKTLLFCERGFLGQKVFLLSRIRR